MIRSRSNIEHLRGAMPSRSNLCQECGELRQLSMSMGGCLCHAFTDKGSKLKGALFVKKAAQIKGTKSQRRKKRKAAQSAKRQQKSDYHVNNWSLDEPKKLPEVIWYEPSVSLKQ